jgi:hypothetical protein
MSIFRYNRAVSRSLSGPHNGRGREVKTPEEKLNEARDAMSTIIHLIDSRDPEASPAVLLDLIRHEAVECLDSIRED